MPERLKDQIFEKLFIDAELALYSQEELMTYDASLKAYRDNINTLDFAREEGLEEGRQKGREEGLEEGLEKGREEEREKMAKAMLANGMSKDIIAKCTGLPIEKINSLTTD